MWLQDVICIPIYMHVIGNDEEPLMDLKDKGGGLTEYKAWIIEHIIP